MFELVLIANAIWFALGFHLFALRGTVFAKILIAREHRDTRAFDVLAESGKFLGGFNVALCAFSLFLALQAERFPDADQRIVLCLFFALAHGSQFVYNVPIALQNRRGEGVWRVEGLMRFIFITDFTLMMANAAIALTYL